MPYRRPQARRSSVATDLSTTWLGLNLPEPFIVGASPLCDDLDSVRAVVDAGASAIVLRSLFEEQIEVEALATQAATETHAESFGEALSYWPQPDEFVLGPQEYLEHLRRVKGAVRVPVIASLNGRTPGGWLEYAAMIEQAGADALELNLYDVITDAKQSAEQVEARSIEMLRAVRKALHIPIAVKLSPFYTALPHFAARLCEAGADGLVLFNRFFEPDVDPEQLETRAHLRLSTSSELLLRLRWLGILSPTLPASLAVSGGVHTALDAIKAIMCGAHVVQVVSALLRNGPEQLLRLRSELREWMGEHGYDSLNRMRGCMNLARCPDPTAFERGNYMRMLQTWQPE